MSNLEVNRALVANRLLKGGAGRTYLEIGVERGFNFRKVTADLKLGVDPCLKIRLTRHPARRAWEFRGHLNRVRGAESGQLLFPETSDDFFARHSGLLGRRKLDVALVDGLHTAEQACRNVRNCLRFLNQGGVVMLHDCRPRNAAAALHSEADAKQHPDYTGDWNGDVWRAVLQLRSELTDHRVLVLDGDQGLGLVFRGRPAKLPALSGSAIETLSYDEFRRNQAELLDLRQPEELARILAELEAGGA